MRTVEEMAAAVQRSHTGDFYLEIEPGELDQITDMVMSDLAHRGHGERLNGLIRDALAKRFPEYAIHTGNVPGLIVMFRPRPLSGAETKRGESDES